MSKKEGHKGTRLYRIWQGMKNRALNPNYVKRHRYADRGIDICDDWLTFVPFKEWAEANGYADNLQIDRIDNDKGYHPWNCRFVTQLENMRNSSRATMTVEFAALARKMYETGTFTYVSLAQMFGVSKSCINHLLNQRVFKGI